MKKKLADSMAKILIKLIQLTIGILPLEDGLRFLFDLDNRLYLFQEKTALNYGHGLHPKYRLTGYHQFFIHNIRPGEKILDIGCGQGYVAYQIAKNVSRVKVTGIDLEASNIRLAKKLYRHPRLNFVRGDVLKKLPRKKYDVIILSNVLEHFKNRVGFLRKIVRQLKPDRLLIRVPCFERDWRVALKKELLIDYRLDKNHFTEYTQEQFFQELGRAGLAAVKTQIRWGEIWSITKPI